MLHTLHDWQTTSYEVNGAAREITLQCVWSYSGQPRRFAKAVFQAVEGYRVWDDAFSNIILDIECVSATVLLEAFGAEIRDSHHMSGAHGPWASRMESAAAHLESAGIKGYLISSSYGMSAWILAKDLKIAELSLLPPEP